MTLTATRWPPPEPPWTRDLPRAYGHIPPWNKLPGMANSDPGGQNFRNPDESPDIIRGMALTLNRRCHMCGCRVEGNCWTIWWDGPEPTYAPAPSPYSGVGYYKTTSPMPLHRSCCLYSALVCRLMLSPTARYGKNTPKGCPGAMRGGAYLVEARHYGVLPDGETLVWDFHSRPFGLARELADEYAEALTTDKVDTSTRMYWRSDSELVGVRQWVRMRLHSQWPPLRVLA